MTIREFLSKTFDSKKSFSFRPLIHCKDGFTISVQASKGHYCFPREYTDKYSSLEVGYPSELEPLLSEYSEIPGEKSVFSFVPIEVIEQVIEKHGGIDVSLTFKK